MSSVNKVILLGNTGKTPEIRTLNNGSKVATFSIATNSRYKDKSGTKIENVEWHNIVVWNPLSDIVEKYLKKGDKVYIEGKATNRKYTDDNNITRFVNEVVAKNIVLISNNAERGIKPPPITENDKPVELQNSSNNTDDEDENFMSYDDDLPF